MTHLYNTFCAGPAPVARLLTIYIQEADHGRGLFNATKPVVNFHRTIEDRLAAANRFIVETHWQNGEVVCDSLADDIMNIYDSHPERICVIQSGIVVHDGSKKGRLICYNIAGVMEWLTQRDTRPKKKSSNDYEDDNEGSPEAVCSS
jgi:Iodothyronine deiodinase